MSLPNIEYIMNMTREYIKGTMDGVTYSLDLPYELEKRYKEMEQEDDEYSELIYECLYEEGVCHYNGLSDTAFKKLIRKNYNYIKKIAQEGFY